MDEEEAITRLKRSDLTGLEELVQSDTRPGQCMRRI